MDYDCGEIRELIKSALDNDQLRNLCLDKFYSVHNNFADDQSKDSRIRMLVDYADRQKEIPKLLEEIKKINPNRYAEFEPRLSQIKKEIFGRRRSREVPRLLPYLPNRTQQEFEVRNAVKKLKQDSSKPLVYIIHGDKSQGHDTFIDRLKEYTLPESLELGEQSSIQRYDINFPSNSCNVSEFHEQLQQELARQLPGTKPLATIKEINDLLAAHPVPVIIHSQIPVWKLLQKRTNCVKDFLEFLQNFTLLSSGQYLIFCLSIKYEIKQNSCFFKNSHSREIPQLLQRLSAIEFKQVIVTVLPPLEDVAIYCVEQWVRDKRTQKFLDEEMRTNLIKEIQNLFEKRKKGKRSKIFLLETLVKRLIALFQNKTSTEEEVVIPMEYLAQQLKALLQGNDPTEEESA